MGIVELRIKNFVLVKDTVLEFSPGLNIITGETGAGKSLLVNALNIIVGERATPELIGNYGKSAEISAIFELEPKHVPIVQEIGFDVEDGQLILRRILRQSGSRAYINGTPVTRSQLKEVTSVLIDIHGQHSHQSLLNESTHIQFLDRFGELEELVGQVASLYREWQDALRKLESEKKRLEELFRMKEYLEFQLNELENANLRENEDVEIEERLAVLTHIERIQKAAGEALELIYESEDSAHSRVSRAISMLESISQFDPSFNEMIDSLSAVETTLAEVGSSLSGYLQQLIYDPVELEELNERYALINRLKHKYRTNLNGLIELRENLRRQLSELELGDVKLQQLEQEAAQKERKFFEVATVLSRKRREAARRFKEKVEKELSELGMADATFSVEIQSSPPSESGIDSVRFAVMKPSESGIDTIRFMIATVPGEEPRPLVKIVSGGELSRIMLAMKVVLAEVDEVETLVFDEIDVGISGRIAESVGRKMKQVSEKHQVIAITHLPQIAAFADRHFKVEKQQSEGIVASQVIQLDREGRIKELASMLTGEKLTDASIKQALELLKMANSQF